jgi:hypothetical protein
MGLIDGVGHCVQGRLDDKCRQKGEEEFEPIS